MLLLLLTITTIVVVIVIFIRIINICMLICMEDVYMYTCVSVSMTYAKREDNCSANGSHTIKNFIQHNTPQCSIT